MRLVNSKKYEKEPRRVLDTRRGASYNVGRKVEYLLADCSASNFIQKSPKQGPSLWAVFCYLSFFSSNTTRSPSERLAARNLERNARKYPAAYPGTERGGAQTRDKIMRKTEIISKSLMLSPRAEAEGFSSRTARSAPQMKTPPHECGGTNQYDVSRGIPPASTFLPTLLS